ncbi:MAG TPA: hypothetical protein VMT19_04860 [Thermoanaerobaculaceae bacterium]|nr:hypothetical protein [Thermoanaerobaculaceae bacterium]
MTQLNARRIWLGAFIGWLVWGVWSTIINMVILVPRYAVAQKAGAMLTQPRYPFFVPVWFVVLFVLAGIGAWSYAGARATRGAGPATAFKVGATLGFASGFPIAFSLAAWAPFSRFIALGWMLDLWVGAILATVVAGWLYKD